MSSQWILQERYGLPLDTSLHTRLKHYLQLKVQYGYYEFFSTVYSPYCLAGLLNLADFSHDAEIKQLATLASQRLLKDLLLVTNDQGVAFPTAGRNYYGKYANAYGQNHSSLIYLLTGMGKVPGGATHAGGFLASSSLEIDSVSNSWMADIDTEYDNGHSLDTMISLNSVLNGEDKTLFKWSGGAYFHPKVAQETAQLLKDSSLWAHPDFAAFNILQFVPIANIPAMALTDSALSEGSVICGEKIHVFKHHSVTLTSIHDFWKGKLGYQEFPCVAAVGRTAVLTASGQVKKNWGTRSATNANEHLPYVEQKANVALIMYRPEWLDPLFGFHHKQVALYFKNSDYDEVREDSMWLLGRQDNNYVAVRRHCLGQIDSVPACEMDHGQTWVIIVGDSLMYGSFNHFDTLISHSIFEESWHYDSLHATEVYFASIQFDTTHISYAWERDSVGASGISMLPEKGIAIYPNPVNDLCTIDLGDELASSAEIVVYDMIGRELFHKQIEAVDNRKILLNTASWNAGLYEVLIRSAGTEYHAKLLK